MLGLFAHDRDPLGAAIGHLMYLRNLEISRYGVQPAANMPMYSGDGDSAYVSSPMMISSPSHSATPTLSIPDGSMLVDPSHFPSYRVSTPSSSSESYGTHVPGKEPSRVPQSILRPSKINVLEERDNPESSDKNNSTSEKPENDGSLPHSEASPTSPKPKGVHKAGSDSIIFFSHKIVTDTEEVITTPEGGSTLKKTHSDESITVSNSRNKSPTSEKSQRSDSASSSGSPTFRDMLKKFSFGGSRTVKVAGQTEGK
jgi:hypothetical protein